MSFPVRSTALAGPEPKSAHQLCLDELWPSLGVPTMQSSPPHARPCDEPQEDRVDCDRGLCPGKICGLDSVLATQWGVLGLRDVQGQRRRQIPPGVSVRLL